MTCDPFLPLSLVLDHQDATQARSTSITTQQPATTTARSPDGSSPEPGQDSGPGRIIHAFMTLAIEASPPLYGAAHCTFTDIDITCDLMDEGQTPAVTYPPDEPFGPVLAELIDRYRGRRAADLE